MRLHCELVTLTSKQLLRADQGPVTLAVTGDPGHALFDDCMAAGCQDIVLQNGDGLGERMFSALQRGLEDYDRVMLVGSDCPDLDPAYCRSAVLALDHHDLVLGPAEDGGYVLVGARCIAPALFRGVDWGTSEVLAQTLSRAEACNLSVYLLASRRDIDEPADYHWWRTEGEG